jgi:hypothetical protein
LLLVFFVVLLRSFNPVCSSFFVCVAFQPIDVCSVPSLPHFHQFVHSLALQWLSNFYSSWDECPTSLWTLPTFSDLANMTHEDLTSPVAAAATAQVKLCPYDEEEPHIWFRLIEAQFAAAGIKSQKLKYANGLAACPSKSFGTFWILLMSAATWMSRSTF